MRANRVRRLLVLVFLSGSIVLQCAKNKQDAHQKFIDEYKQISVGDICLENKNIKKEDFLFGVGTSSYQIEGHAGAKNPVYNQWVEAVGTQVTVEIGGKKEKKEVQNPQQACEHYTRYKEDIKLIKDLGCNAYRFSIAWGKVEPEEGKFDPKVLKHYENKCKELKKQGIRPVITLYHYTHPVWFEKKGAFEKEENVSCFVNYCTKMFETLKKYNPIWFTINTFTGVSFHAYYVGTKPPFKKDMGLALQVLKHVLQAHVEFYHKAKKIDKEAMIGIYKMVFPIEKYRKWQFWDNFGVDIVNNMNHDAIYEFFTTGKLDITIGLSALFVKESIKYENKEAIGALDYIGINHYSSACMSNFKVMALPKYIPTQSNLLTIYPQGFYDAIIQVHEKLALPLIAIKNKEVPIYITENGIATDNEMHRDVFYRSYLQQLSKAMSEGVDIRGYMTWSLMDNFDWLEGYNFNFGLYAVDRQTQQRTLKDGANFFIEVITAHNKKELQKESQVSQKAVIADANTVVLHAADAQAPVVLQHAGSTQAKTSII